MIAKIYLQGFQNIEGNTLPLHPYLLPDQGPFIADMEVVEAVFEVADT